ncbi:allantoate amidohydrolase [Edaphobacter aggregans]|uniref:allantoate amidohydrolase n=1 Tax=Edaphobacter aggregans TaxID=570835 RepID=UPI000ABB70FE|nr:allantoate amidohydrolase [Edaphobacter aggregans]
MRADLAEPLERAKEATSTASRAAEIKERCRQLAQITDIPGQTTRSFLSPAMRRCMGTVQSWMEAAQMSITIDAAGNLRGLYPGSRPDALRLVVGSHLDTVPNAGAFDGVLGVLLGLALVESLEGQRLSFAIELIAFSEEEGVRFGVPFIGSRAVTGQIDRELLSTQDAEGISVRQAMLDFGLDPERLPEATLDRAAAAYLEFHIEQGPALESEDRSLGVVDCIAGQTRGEVIFTGASNHAGTTPMRLRRDALAAAAEWIAAVERLARNEEGLVATVGRIEVHPGAENVIAGEAQASLDVRHADDAMRRSAVERLIAATESIARARSLEARWCLQMDQVAVAMDAQLSQMAVDAIRGIGLQPLRMMSGAGHDAMIIASRLPSAMIFLRSPGGISHHPDESVRIEDVANALNAGLGFLRGFHKVIIGAHA